MKTVATGSIGYGLEIVVCNLIGHGRLLAAAEK